MIFHDRKAIFFHVGKAAGTSIEYWFEGKYHDPYVTNRAIFFGWDKEENIFLQHSNIATMKRHIDPAIMEGYYKFAVVRNPFSRMVSCYYYFRSGLKDKTRFPTFQSYVEDLPKAVKTRHAQNGAHVSPQIPYTHFEGRLYCDDVCYFEKLPASLAPVQKALGLTTLPPKTNTQRNPEWPDCTIAEMYTPAMKRIIQDIYTEDFRIYGYDAERPETLAPLKDKVAA